MDPEMALKLVKQGATLLLVDVPQYTLIGIDTQVFTVGPAFKGVKMIPLDPHFVFYDSSSRHGKGFSPIIGFFCHVGPSEIIVLKWDLQEEKLVKVSEEEDYFLLVQDASVVDGDLLSWTRRLKELLEKTLGWEFQQKSTVDGIYFEEDDKVSVI